MAIDFQLSSKLQSRQQIINACLCILQRRGSKEKLHDILQSYHCHNIK